MNIEIENLESNETQKEQPLNMSNDITIGKLLKEAREKKTLSVEAISRHTKISMTNLEYLESDDKENLPNIAYVKGFVKSYCKIVDVDFNYAQELLQDLYHVNTRKQESPVEEIEEVHEEPVVQEEKKSAPIEFDTSLMAKAGGVIVLLAIVVFTIVNRDETETREVEAKPKDIVVKPQVLTANTPLTNESAEQVATNDSQEEQNDANEESLEAANKQENAVVETKTEPETKKVEKETATPAVEEKKEEKVVEKKEVEKKEELKADNKKKVEEKLEFYPIPIPMYDIESSDKDVVEALMPKGYYNIMKNGGHNIFIKAVTGDTWLTYKSDDKAVKKFVLKKDRYILIRGNEHRIFLGNVHATKIVYNNNLLSIKSKSGVKSLVFPLELATKVKLPLFIFNKDGTVSTSTEYLKNNQ